MTIYENMITTGRLRPNRNKVLYWMAIHHLASFIFGYDGPSSGFDGQDQLAPPSAWEREQLLSRIVESAMDKVTLDLTLPCCPSSLADSPCCNDYLVSVWRPIELFGRRRMEGGTGWALYQTHSGTEQSSTHILGSLEPIVVPLRHPPGSRSKSARGLALGLLNTIFGLIKENNCLLA